MTAADSDCAIAVMAKAPRAGSVKTRLVPPLTHEAARTLSASFLRDVTENIRLASTMCAVTGYVAYAPAGLESLFDGMLAPETQLVLADGAGLAPPYVEGFGRCLLHATETLFAHGHSAVCLLNSDSPNLPTECLVEAARVLAQPGDRIVLGPAEDGGYYLIGMKAPYTRLFEDISWSTGEVAEETRDRVRDLDIELVELPIWYDVDDENSLTRLLQDLSSRTAPGGRFEPYEAPATRALAESLGLFELLGVMSAR